MRDAKRVAVTAAGPRARVRSIETLRPRSARSGPSSVSRVSPAASISSVSGVGPKNPVPADRRVDQPPERSSADTRGLKNQPYSLWRSSRPLSDSASHGRTSMSSCTNRPGVVKAYSNRGTSVAR